MIYLIYKSTEAKTVAQENEFVLELSAFFSSSGQELYCLGPLSVRRLCFTSKRVKMVHK